MSLDQCSWNSNEIWISVSPMDFHWKETFRNLEKLLMSKCQKSLYQYVKSVIVFHHFQKKIQKLKNTWSTFQCQWRQCYIINLFSRLLPRKIKEFKLHSVFSVVIFGLPKGKPVLSLLLNSGRYQGLKSRQCLKYAYYLQQKISTYTCLHSALCGKNITDSIIRCPFSVLPWHCPNVTSWSPCLPNY